MAATATSVRTTARAPTGPQRPRTAGADSLQARRHHAPGSGP